jgi:D-alanyl-D-alanine carboxypeptidase/D-alanyl-D-alanine-endopeptidase (penicillin-binding protein 4)
VNRRGRTVLRLIALLCAAGAVALAVVARPTDDRAGAQPVDAPARTPLLSPRRVPALFIAALGRVRLQRELTAIAAPFNACVAVDDADGSLARVNAGASLAPASNVKLLTAAAALQTLGPAYRFRTRVVVDAGGNLVLVGGGDPGLSSSPTTTGAVTSLEELARTVAAAGPVTGPILVDDSRFDSTRVVPDWKSSYIANGEVGPIGALSVDSGFVNVASRTPAPDPAILAGTRFEELLRTHGVTIAGSPAHTTAPADAREIAHIDSPPLSTIVEDMLRTSNNYAAEMLTRELGVAASKTGTTAAGTSAIVNDLAAMRVPTTGVTLHDGSGLAPDNRVTCDVLLRVLALARRGKFVAIDRGLPVAGRTGTLALRFQGDALAGVLRAKTGSINGVVGLTGTIDAGPRPRFAFLANGSFSTAAGARLQDDVAHAVARYPDASNTAMLVPEP